MADFGRDVVTDPFARNPREQEQGVSLPTYGVRNPGQGAGKAATQMGLNALNVIDGIQASVMKISDQLGDNLKTRGSLDAMTGKVDAELVKTNQKTYGVGVASVEADAAGAGWFQEMAGAIENDEEVMSMDPKEFNQKLMDGQAQKLKDLGDKDPAIQKQWIERFKTYGPRLAAAQTEQHNKYLEQRGVSGLTNALMGGSDIAPDASVKVNDDGFRINPSQVEQPVDVTPDGRDVAIRTMLGEAGAEGQEGMAAVAHVLINRTRDSRFPHTVQEVALAKDQFTAWSKGPGGNDPLKWDSNSEAYKNAGAIFDAVSSGHHVDPTNGAINYYSPSGMKPLVEAGAAPSETPAWAAAATAESGGQIRIGGHVFMGKSNGRSKTYTDPQVSTQGQPAEVAAAMSLGGGNTGQASVQTQGQPPVPGIQTTRPKTGTSLQQQIMSSPLRAALKAEALSRAIVTKLDTGDDGLLNDSGGVATLTGLGATPAQIDAVYKAKQRFDDKQDKQYDLNYETARANLLQGAKNGDYGDVNAAMAAADDLHKKFGGSDAEAKSLARQVANEYAKAAGQDIVPLELRDLAAKVKSGLDSGYYQSTNDAAQQILDYKSKHPEVKASVIDSFVQDVYSRAQSNNDKNKSDLRTALDKKAKETQVINQASQALVRGTGLKGLGGQADIPDDANPGKVKTVNGEEYGIWALKKKTGDDINGAIQQGKMTKEEGQVQYYNGIYENLRKQGVYDTTFGQQVGAAVTGNVIDPKTHAPTDAAMNALSFYMQMRDNKNVGSDYLAGMIQDPQARTFLETAATLYDGRNDISTSVMKASTILDQHPEGVDKLGKTVAFNLAVPTKIKEAVGELVARDSVFGPANQADIQATVDASKQTMEAYVSARAEGYHMDNVNIPTEAAVNMAKDDLIRNGIVVGKNMIIGDESKGTRLDQAMGLTTQGKQGPNDALAAYMKENGPRMWGTLWTDQHKPWSERLQQDLYTDLFGRAFQPDMEVNYNASQKVLEVRLYKDNTRGETVGSPMYLPADELGDWYKNKVRTGEITTLNTVERMGVDKTADMAQWFNKKRAEQRNLNEAGKVMGQSYTGPRE